MRIIGFANEHKGAVVAALLLLAALVAASVVGVALLSHGDTRGEDVSAQSEQTEEVLGDEGGVALSEEQIEAIGSYDDETYSFIDMLCEGAWSGGGDTLSFERDCYSVTDANGETERHSYAILRLEEEGGGTDGSATAVVKTDAGTHTLSLTRMTETAPGGSRQVTSTLSSDSMFGTADASFERTDAGVEEDNAASPVTVTGLSKEASSFLGGDVGKLEEALSSWCAAYFPTAAEAVWNGSVTIDYKNRLVTTEFTLKGESDAPVTVIYHSDNGAFQFDG